MKNLNYSVLFERANLRERKDVPSWFLNEFETFSTKVSDPTFPCYFGMTAFKRDELRYSYVPNQDWSSLPGTLVAFLQLMQERPLVRRGLFVFVEPEKEERTLSYYRDYFWNLLQFLHEHDEYPWPKHIPTNPDHHLWEFSFGGEAIFAFGNAPAYKQRKTRQLGNSLVIGFQPRIIFEGLEGNRPKGAYSRQTVRERVEKWDGLPKHPNISHYGDLNHHEWKQYFIGDDCKPIEGSCPFQIKEQEK
ncbi:YqcI/YcgG family protein [Ectobacillus polymachus]|uniref:YqcI/YcgG family protein n=1 Tax=Ectobacillus polymachus TaxID=1508806 RepID=UPI003A8B4AE2